MALELLSLMQDLPVKSLKDPMNPYLIMSDDSPCVESLQSLQLYREFVPYQDSEVTMSFVAGLLARHQLFLSQEHVNL